MSADVVRLVASSEPELVPNIELAETLESFAAMARAGELVAGAFVGVTNTLSTQFASHMCNYPITLMGAIDIMHHDVRCKISRATEV